ncbi:MAG: S-adenosylmethionine decarboxylase [SAR324 cluster bacterium]|nr:S-adenosylmethionine decarboxylase [SAR324 cluster bacterium]
MDSNQFIGRHLIVDVQTATMRNINEISVVYTFLEKLSKLLKMTLVYPPIVVHFPFVCNELQIFHDELKEDGIQSQTMLKMEQRLKNRNTEHSGVSGITVWIESHVVLRTWKEQQYISFEACSCKDFDTQIALDCLCSYFDIKAYNGIDIVRYINEPQEIRPIYYKSEGYF